MKKTTFSPVNLTRVLLMLLIVLYASSSFGQTAIFSNTITGTNPGADNPYSTDQVVVTNITATGIGRGSGIDVNTASNRYNAKSFNTSITLDANDYFTFTITPATGYKINFASFVYTAQKSGTGPKQFALRSSIDNYATNIYTYSDTGAASATWTETAALSASTLQNITSSVTFRYYAWNAGADAGTFSINDFIFNGTVATAGVTAPANPVATAATNVTGTSFTANWNAVTGATSYSLDVATDINFNTILAGYTALTVNGTSQNVTGLTANTNYYYRVVARNSTTSLASDYSNIITVCGTPAPVAAATQTYCGATTVANLAATGTAVKWYTVATGGTALDGTATVATGTYYAAQTLNGCEGTRATVAVTVNNTAVPTIGTQTFCGSAKVSDFIVTTGTGVKWYAAATGGTALASTDAVFVGTYYASQTLNSCESARIPVTVAITTTAVPTIGAQTFCNSANVSDFVITTGTAVKWYAAATGGVALDATTALTTGTTYYATQTLNSCESARTPVTVTINTTAAPFADAQTFCTTNGVPTVANLTVTTGTAVKWYAVATGGVALDATTALTTGTTYYASQTLNNCESTLRTPVVVTINATVAPVADAQTFCATDGIPTVAKLAVTTGTDVKWYAAQTGGVALDATTVLLTGATYYVSQTLNNCESLRVAVPVTINTTAAPDADAEQIFCNAATVANLTVNEPVSKNIDIEVKWYAGLAGGDALEATEVLTTGNTYYVSQTVNNCESVRTAVVVTVNKTTAPVADAQTFCDAATVANLKVTTGTDVKWYAAETGGDALEATTVLITGATYYASQILNDCESARTAVVVTIAIAVKPEGEATQNFTEGKTLADLTVTGADIVWYADSELTKVLPETTVLTDAATYYAVSTIDACQSDALAITVKKVLSAAGFDKANFTYYPNPVKDVLTLSYNTTISSVEVYNMLGQVVITTKVNANQPQVTTANLAAGTYIVKATAGNKTQTFKVVKQ